MSHEAAQIKRKFEEVGEDSEENSSSDEENLFLPQGCFIYTYFKHAL